jgi:hypothetical protein
MASNNYVNKEEITSEILNIQKREKIRKVLKYILEKEVKLWLVIITSIKKRLHRRF